jgi:hypothetical protein
MVCSVLFCILASRSSKEARMRIFRLHAPTTFVASRHRSRTWRQKAYPATARPTTCTPPSTPTRRGSRQSQPPEETLFIFELDAAGLCHCSVKNRLTMREGALTPFIKLRRKCSQRLLQRLDTAWAKRGEKAACVTLHHLQLLPHHVHARICVDRRARKLLKRRGRAHMNMIVTAIVTEAIK